MSIQFTQSCPTCGRRVQLRADLLGASVACQHCKAEFVAQADADTVTAGRGSGSLLATGRDLPSDPLMDRVERALARVDDPTAIT